eukprot:Skav220679  [mRNA]  locus=scaffold384:206145:208968:- [translate_table: standard]
MDLLMKVNIVMHPGMEGTKRSRPSSGPYSKVNSMNRGNMATVPIESVHSVASMESREATSVKLFVAKASRMKRFT